MTGLFAPREHVTYVFALCRASSPPPRLAGATGHGGGAPVRVLSTGVLAAVVQDVPAAEFSERALRSRLSDRVELERCARAHHEVVAAAAEEGPAVPLPLATVYQDDARVRQTLTDDERRFLTVLERIEGRVEWGVKVYAPRPRAAVEPTVVAPSSGGATRGTGRAYLERLRDRQRGREHRRAAAVRAAERVDAAVRELAVAARRLRPHGAELTSDQREQILNAAYLLAEHQAAALYRAIASSRDDGNAEVEVSGPWAPYSFVQEADTDD